MIIITIHQSRNGSSPGFKAGLKLSDSGYDEKLEVSLGALLLNKYILLDYWFIRYWYLLLMK